MTQIDARFNGENHSDAFKAYRDKRYSRHGESEAKESARSRIEDIATEIRTAYQSFRALSRELRANCDRLTGLPEVHKLIRTEWKRTKAEIRSLRMEREKLQENYWEAVL